MLMGVAVSGLAAGLLAFTILFYAVVHTMWLKRFTAQNIVDCTGLAGASPPAIGWAAAAGTAPLNAWLLVAIIFMWTRPRLPSALSLYTSEDYEKAGVPMMPLVAGASPPACKSSSTACSWSCFARSPAFTGLGGPAYLGVAALGGAVFLILAWRLFRSRAGDTPGDARNAGADGELYDVKVEAKAARNMFAFSIPRSLLFASLLASGMLSLR